MLVFSWHQLSDFWPMLAKTIFYWHRLWWFLAGQLRQFLSTLAVTIFSWRRSNHFLSMSTKVIFSHFRLVQFLLTLARAVFVRCKSRQFLVNVSPSKFRPNFQSISTRAILDRIDQLRPGQFSVEHIFSWHQPRWF